MMTAFHTLRLAVGLILWRPPRGVTCTLTYAPATGQLGAVLESEANLTAVEFDPARPARRQLAAMERECREMLRHDRYAIRLEDAARTFERGIGVD